MVKIYNIPKSLSSIFFTVDDFIRVESLHLIENYGLYMDEFFLTFF